MTATANKTNKKQKSSQLYERDNDNVRHKVREEKKIGRQTLRKHLTETLVTQLCENHHANG